jgi:hypothetical protein
MCRGFLRTLKPRVREKARMPRWEERGSSPLDGSFHARADRVDAQGKEKANPPNHDNRGSRGKIIPVR